MQVRRRVEVMHSARHADGATNSGGGPSTRGEDPRTVAHSGRALSWHASAVRKQGWTRARAIARIEPGWARPIGITQFRSVLGVAYQRELQ